MHVIGHNDPGAKPIQVFSASFKIVNKCFGRGRLLQVSDMYLRIQIAFCFADKLAVNRPLYLRTQLTEPLNEAASFLFSFGLPLFKHHVRDGAVQPES